jgi:teichuronic acid biosynthesis glycosyltransferase TuaH
MTPPDYDIVMLALPRWDGAYSSTAYSLAKELSRYTRVFYIDNPFTYKDYWAGKNGPQIQRRKNALLHGKDIFTSPDKTFPNLIAVTPKLTLPINWLPKGVVYNLLSRWNDAIMMRAIDETLKSFSVKKFVFINSFNPLFGKYFPARFNPFLNIYHCVDDISKSAYVSKHGTHLENEAVSTANLTLVTSSELKRLKSKHSPHVYDLPNAADVALFQKAVNDHLAKPKELEGITKKIICYTGNICHRLDYDLLVKIAKTHHDKILLMIGPFANDNYKKAGLDKIENVIFAGRKSIEELPAYLKYSDCCIIPFLCIPLTRSIYPLKINEYLSAGKPVVTTNFSEDIANFGKVAFVSDNHQEFLDNISVGINTDSQQKVADRVTYSSGNSWSSRAKQFFDIVDKHVSDGKRQSA